MSKRPPYNENAAIRGALRRTFSRSPIIREVLQKVRREVPRIKKDGSRAKKDHVQYQCQTCMQYVSSTQIAVDHIDPVIPVVGGFTNWESFITRLFCGPENLQTICESCHRVKSLKENRARRMIKDTATLKELQQRSDLDEKEQKLLKRLTKKSQS